MNVNKSFWISMHILISKPHVVNKKLWGCKKLFQCFIKPLNSDWENALQNFKIEEAENVNIIIQQISDNVPIKLFSQDDNGLVIILTKLFPKVYTKQYLYQLICLNYNDNVITFYDVTPKEYNQNIGPNFPFSFCIENDKIILNVKSDVTKTVQWLENTVLPQVVKWSQEELHKSTKVIRVESLNSVPVEKYYEKYNELKSKYVKELVRIWPESTDPLKFIHEDVAIATYLLIYWGTSVGSIPQTFVDVGCGNGLLVYLLTMEGHTGFGVDVRKRKIWDWFPNAVKLRVHTVTPSSIDIFSNCEWIIGNHSDELTPWIPVMAAKCSYKCNFFLLPCCAYNFDGTKYQRKDSSFSQYNDYLKYVEKICEDCGFQTQVDRLKIPSTKRICFVSNNRVYAEEKYNEYLNKIEKMITDSVGINTMGEEYNVKTRNPIEKVRNCTQIDKNVVQSIIKCITDYLLMDIDLKSQWSPGKSAKMNELIPFLNENMLRTLKSECGGLQTLLRNNSHIFQIQNGNVQLRYPKTVNEVKSKKTHPVKIQINKCWFFVNHPQGCPLQSTVCSYLH